MRLIGSFAGLMLLWAVGAAAQTLPIRSGEHGSFTRLVVDLPARTDWQLDPREDGGGYILRFPDRDFGFDTSAVFDRIDTDRVASIAAGDPGTLAIDLACNCVIRAQMVGQRMLSLDVSAAEAEEALPTAAAPPATAPPVSPDWQSLSQRDDPFDRLLARNLEAALPTQEELEIERAFAEEISTAATYGILSLNRRPPPTALAPKPPDDTPAGVAPPLSSEPTLADVTRMILERDKRDRRIRLTGDRCLPDAKLDIANWGGPEPYHQQIGALRAGLTGEFDRPQPASVTALAKLYLHFGFGAEARSVLGLADVPDAAVLSGLSAIIDNDVDRAPAFAGQAHCDTAAAMWAVLETSPDPVSTDLNEGAVLTAFETLPPHLKQLLAARLADGLRASGSSGAARSVLSRVKRSIDAVPPDIKLAEARVEAPDKDVSETIEDLQEIAETAAPETSAAAVETLISLAAQEDQEVAPNITELASAYVTEYRGSEEAARLWRAHIRALLSQVRIGEALEVIAGAGDIDEDTREVMRGEVFETLVSDADDMTFLRHVVAEMRPGEVKTSDKVMVAAIDRLLKLGLADEALSAIARLDMPETERPRRILQARAHLALFEPEDAELALVGLQGEDVTPLRIEARLQMGDYAFAADAYEAAGQTEDQRRAAWIAGDWPQLSENGGDDPLSDAAQFVDRPTEVPENTLAATGALADDAAQSLETLRSLLQSTELSSEDEN